MVWSRFFSIALITLWIYGCTSPAEDALHIATAANVQFAMDELTEIFTNQTGIRCEVILGSSGKLMAQIREGAPYHIFVSADMKYPETLYKDGLTLDPPEIYAYGSLVLWTFGDSAISINDLTSPVIKKIALANPGTAPYGRAARQSMEFYGLYENLDDRLVFGESISQTNQFIISRTADAGFTAKSVVSSPDWKSNGYWTEIDPAAYDPIEQGVVVVNSQPEEITRAVQFRTFLLSDEASGILEKYGYTVSR